MSERPIKITGANAGGPHQLPMRTHWAARIAAFCRWQRVKSHYSRKCVLVILICCALVTTARAFSFWPPHTDWTSKALGSHYGFMEWGDGRTLVCLGSRGFWIPHPIQDVARTATLCVACAVACPIITMLILRAGRAAGIYGSRMNTKYPFVLVICLLGLGANAQSYRVTDLGVLGRPEMGLNNNSQITGTTVDNKAFRWDTGVMTTLGTLGGTSFGRGINDVGQIAGYAYIGDSMRAVVFNGTNLTDLGALPSAVANNPVAIHNLGQVVGLTITGPGSYPYVATLWQGGNVTNLGTLSGNNSRASDINNLATIVGNSGNHAFVYTSVTGMQPVSDPPGFVPGSITASALNDSGSMVGSGSPTNYVQGARALVWKQGTVLDIGLLIPPKNSAFSFAHDINSFEEVVGDSDSPTGTHAFLYDSTNGMRDLNRMITDTNWVLTSAVAINDSGQIIGLGSHNGQTRGFLLTPAPILKLSAVGDQLGFLASKLAKNWHYTVQYSENLTTWSNLQTFIASSNQTNWQVSLDPSSLRRFFRFQF